MRLRKNAKVELIKGVPLFSELGNKHLDEVASIADEIDLPGGRDLTVEGRPGQQEHFLSLPLHHCSGRCVSCGSDPEQHWHQFMEPTARQFTEMQRRSHLHHGCRAEVFRDRLA